MRNLYQKIKRKKLSVHALYLAAAFVSAMFFITAREMTPSSRGVMLGSAVLLWCVGIAADLFCKRQALQKKEREKKTQRTAAGKHLAVQQLNQMTDKYRGRQIAAFRKR